MGWKKKKKKNPVKSRWRDAVCGGTANFRPRPRVSLVAERCRGWLQNLPINKQYFNIKLNYTQYYNE